MYDILIKHTDYYSEYKVKLIIFSSLYQYTIGIIYNIYTFYVFNLYFQYNFKF